MIPSQHEVPSRARPGCRCSRGDLFVLLVALVVTVAAHRTFEAWSLFVPLVVGHFFLFCNVFRIRRRYELIWAALLILNAGAWLLSGHFTPDNWASAGWLLLIQTPVTIALIVAEMRSGAYHGLGWQTINPQAANWQPPRDGL